MFELVPSAYMRSLFEKHGIVLTDFQKATLIWNAFRKSIDEKLSALKELSITTQDKELCRQIEERITYEEEAFRRFKDNSDGRYVYAVREDSVRCIKRIGFFSDCDMAIEHLINYRSKHSEDRTFKIEKHIIVKNPKDMEGTIPSCYGNENEVKQTKHMRNLVSTLQFDKNGCRKCISTKEMSKDESERVDDCRWNRFENSCMIIPFEGDIGMSVRDTRNNFYGVLATDTEQILEMNRRIEENKLLFSLSDVYVKVCYLTDRGTWVSSRVNPIYLEREEYQVQAGNRKSEAFKKATDSFVKRMKEKNEANSKQASQYANEYVKACILEDMNENASNYINIDDIMTPNRKGLHEAIWHPEKCIMQ